MIAVVGKVVMRDKDKINPNLKTGRIEVMAQRGLHPERSEDAALRDGRRRKASEEVRLKYRYLDLRREKMQYNIRLRHRAALAVRRYLDEHGFYRNRNADAHQDHARRRARLHRAEPLVARAISTRCRSRRRSSNSC